MCGYVALPTHKRRPHHAPHHTSSCGCAYLYINFVCVYDRGWEGWKALHHFAISHIHHATRTPSRHATLAPRWVVWIFKIYLLLLNKRGRGCRSKGCVGCRASATKICQIRNGILFDNDDDDDSSGFVIPQGLFDVKKMPRVEWGLNPEDRQPVWMSSDKRAARLWSGRVWVSCVSYVVQIEDVMCEEVGASRPLIKKAINLAEIFGRAMNLRQTATHSFSHCSSICK